MFDVPVSYFVGLGGGSQLGMAAQEVRLAGVLRMHIRWNHGKHSLGGYGIVLSFLF